MNYWRKKMDINDIINNLPDTNNTTTSIISICEFSLINAKKKEKQKFLDIIPDGKLLT